MKILFLDIDGVANSEESRHKNSQIDEHFCPIACENLRAIFSAHPDLHVVVSSSIRKIYSIGKLRRLISKNIGIAKNKIIGITPSLPGERGEEIKEWIKTNHQFKISSFVILDDDGDMGDLKSHLVRTNFKVGLTTEDAIQVIERLSK